MSDDEADPELLELLRRSLGLTSRPKDEISSDTGVLKDAEYIYDNAIDISIDMYGTKAAAASIYSAMKERNYSTQAWNEQQLHPTREQGFSDIDIVNFVFTLDLLNFSFWSTLSEDQRFQVEYRSKRWTGYKSLLACLRRALEDDIPITTPHYWIDETCSDDKLKNVFRSATTEEMPLLQQRVEILREAGRVLNESFADPTVESEDDRANFTGDAQERTQHVEQVDGATHLPTPEIEGRENKTIDSLVSDTAAPEAIPAQDTSQNGVAGSSVTQPIQHSMQTESNREPLSQPATTGIPNPRTNAPSRPDMSVVRLVEKADRSAGKLVTLLVKYFPSFQDEARFNGRKVRFYKRAQIFVADLWAAFNGTGYGEFGDIGHLTMFADYRVPQMLHSLGVLVYSPSLLYAIRDNREIPSGHSWEVQLRGCSIWYEWHHPQPYMWAVELIRREILRLHPEALDVNAVLIDFLLYDLAKERENSNLAYPPHHTRSTFY